MNFCLKKMRSIPNYAETFIKIIEGLPVNNLYDFNVIAPNIDTVLAPKERITGKEAIEIIKSIKDFSETYDEDACCFCENPRGEYGNNPSPLPHQEDTKCCDDCNQKYVIPARIKKSAGVPYMIPPETKKQADAQKHCCSCCGIISLKNLKKCSKCGVARYCDAECQKEDWSLHKNQCCKAE